MLSSADHTVILSAAAHLKRHPEHLTILEDYSLKYLDREKVLGGKNARESAGEWRTLNDKTKRKHLEQN